MKILVPIKRVNDYNVKVRPNQSNTDVDLTNVKMAVNPFCEIALEEAIRIKEAGNAEEVVAVSVGSEKNQEQLRTALALGADRAILIKTEVEVQPLDVAKILVKIFEKENPKLVLMGKQGIDGDHNQTGQMLGAMLSIPQATFASKVEINADSVNVTREIDGGLETLSVELPAIVTTDLRLNEPRYASLPNIMKAKRKPIDEINLEELGLSIEQKVKTVKVESPSEREEGIKVDSVDALLDKLRNEAKGNRMRTLVIVEHDNENISSSTLCAVSAAQKLGQDVDLLVASSANHIAEKAQQIMGISKVLNFVGDNFKNEIAEDLTACILAVSKDYNFFVASSSTTGKNLMPRISALLDVQQISEVIEIVSNNTFKKPIYAGACIATVESQQEKNIITVRTTAFEKAVPEGGSGQIENIDIPEVESRKSVFVGNELTVSDRPELTSADIVISGGRGMQDGNNFALLDSVANKLNAAVGASRAAVDSGFAPK